MSYNYQGPSERVLRGLGLDPVKHLPAEGVPPRNILIELWGRLDYVRAWVNPRDGSNPRRKHRLMIQCPHCKVTVPAGRTHQHKCKLVAR